MAFEDLLRALTSRADLEVAALLSTAQDQAASIRRESDQRCAERSTTALRDRARVVTMATERAAAEAARLERHRELAAMVQARDRVLLAARAKIARAERRSGQEAAMSDRFAEAIGAIGDVPARLRCAPALVPGLTPFVARYPNVQLAPDAGVSGGFAIESVDGRVVVDEILEHRLTGEAEALGQVALRALETPA